MVSRPPDPPPNSPFVVPSGLNTPTKTATVGLRRTEYDYILSTLAGGSTILTGRGLPSYYVPCVHIHPLTPLTGSRFLMAFPVFLSRQRTSSCWIPHVGYTTNSLFRFRDYQCEIANAGLPMMDGLHTVQSHRALLSRIVHNRITGLCSLGFLYIIRYILTPRPHTSLCNVLLELCVLTRNFIVVELSWLVDVLFVFVLGLSYSLSASPKRKAEALTCTTRHI